MAARRANVSRLLKPASTRILVRSVAMKEQLPELEEDKTQNLKIELLLRGSFHHTAAPCSNVCFCTSVDDGDPQITGFNPIGERDSPHLRGNISY